MNNIYPSKEQDNQNKKSLFEDPQVDWGDSEVEFEEDLEFHFDLIPIRCE
ncbi:unnamed protein product [Paramecium octaurelia]|uniref:Uncharacterized protein n=1 Tax=Paramecium octaurelia TaxID=43137 RepID=A0A8S1VX35_PAROT|nr:unnamed protein product [Paramecium octaurelia]